MCNSGEFMTGWFTGKFEYAIDVKGRISIPAKFRDLIPENSKFHSIRVPKFRIRIYPESEWEKKALQYENLPETEIFDEYRREFYDTQADSDLDGQGRITIPSKQIKEIRYNGGKIIMLGMGKYIEAFCSENENADYDEAERKFADKYYKVNEAIMEFRKSE
ncbi:MAG: hypothetical protein LBH98_05555 [Chitinispirillales bacterium]|jgi:MraZ protein|nr:hypothetical protein [Chitinispirillales bacterium]